jgi:hypothetical protein
MFIGICGFAAVVCLALGPDPYARHFEAAMPSATQLMHDAKNRAGFGDVSHAFVLEVPDDQLLDQIVREWSLKPSVEDDDHTTPSLVALHPPSWRPDENRPETMPIQYEWIDWRAERYRSVWVDRDNRLLYAKFGRW